MTPTSEAVAIMKALVLRLHEESDDPDRDEIEWGALALDAYAQERERAVLEEMDEYLATALLNIVQTIRANFLARTHVPAEGGKL